MREIPWVTFPVGARPGRVAQDLPHFLDFIPGRMASIIATTPATNGAENDVPMMLGKGEFGSGPTTMFVPGAQM